MKYLLALTMSALLILGCETYRKTITAPETPHVTCGVIKSQISNPEFANSIHKLKWISVDGGVYQTLVNTHDANQ